MASTYPYVSGGGALVKAVDQFRRALPQMIDAGVLKKLGIAPKNESYVINILRFVGLIADDGAPTAAGRQVFTIHQDPDFAKGFGEIVQKAYHGLFELHKDAAWSLEQAALVTYFRQTDQTSALVGTRQATTFQTLAAIAGHGDAPKAQATKPTVRKSDPPGEGKQAREKHGVALRNSKLDSGSRGGRDLGLTVRVEINLPVSGDQETYDRIFKSIRENLFNG